MYFHSRLLHLCDNKIELYRELIQNICDDFHYNIKELIKANYEKDIIKIRRVTHTILTVIVYLDRSLELVYLCKSILLYNKTSTSYEMYQPHIENLINYDFSYII